MLKTLLPTSTTAGAAVIAYISDIGSAISILIGLVAGVFTIKFMRLRNEKIKLESEKLRRELEAMGKSPTSE